MGWLYFLIALGIVLAILGAVLKTDNRLKAVSQWTKDGRFISNFRSITEASQRTNVSYSGIGNCCRGTQKTSGGYVWKYGNYKLEQS